MLLTGVLVSLCNVIVVLTLLLSSYVRSTGTDAHSVILCTVNVSNFIPPTVIVAVNRIFISAFPYTLVGELRRLPRVILNY